MSDGPYLLAVGPCWSCKRTFSFNPARVPSIPIDPQTGKPPDIDPEPGGYERAEREPICEACMTLMNARRRERGLPEMPILPGAYGPASASEL